MSGPAFGVRAVPDISLYIHVPFCARKCGYCDFYSVDNADGALIDSVVAATAAQIDALTEAADGPRIDTVYIGGGTPSRLKPEALDVLLTAAERAVRAGGGKPPVEWTVEANPESLSDTLLDACAQRGVGRISVGVQTWQRRLFREIGRAGDPEAIAAALERVKARGRLQLSVDLLTAMPTQSLEECAGDIRRTVSYAPDHISLYTLTIEGGTPLSRLVAGGGVSMPGDDAAAALWRAGIELLTAAGYEHYEVSNFARADRRCRHNLRYWRMLPYAGCGPSAVSTLAGAHGPVRISNPRSVTEYVRSARNGWGASTERISPREFVLEHCMMGFRLADGLDVGRIKEVFGVDPCEVFRKTFDAWRRRGLLEVGGNSARLLPEGMRVLDRFLVELAVELDEADVAAVRWP